MLAPDSYGLGSDPTIGIIKLSGLSLSLIHVLTSNFVLTNLKFQRENIISDPLYVHVCAKLPIPRYLLDRGEASQVGLCLIVQFLHLVLFSFLMTKQPEDNMRTNCLHGLSFVFCSMEHQLCQAPEFLP